MTNETIEQNETPRQIHPEHCDRVGESDDDRDSEIKLRKQISFWTELLSPERPRRGFLRDVA
jgi:hypothetical protein